VSEIDGLTAADVWNYYCTHVDWIHIIAWIDTQYSSELTVSMSTARWPMTEPISAQMIDTLHNLPARLADHLLDRLARSVVSSGSICYTGKCCISCSTYICQFAS